ncbi:PHP domain-containing protein [Pantoea sp. Bo_2]|uniref:5'-3' exoribonuclease Rnm n=1 Tax=Candidatus Pantoea gossypiicola TaxID=2608008 RepID=A0AB34CN18_9GAMM|nr:PHP domain-containing protein [Pantoea sp. VH_8]KAA5937754.1 PHP domain-containing protein [Pantoea sp. VH_4]KAA5940362.1 PHP domain-containing protein [Pantoea sp. VH_3]KAA5948954.1 PHP domain-containing protein [Pantoea sp. VH_25]KAA5960004.1 PHP domain-containing protein [Pantoea sp. VH_24]KAA5963631.1 PHP domain-containing protein [Pantoea sp. VH_16]KAA5967805.1 PHP domain-containing protein [Pantoea sp. VH_18]KAA5978710.1 PHP domain-containing protein [Pantoea sp. M_3]KAA5988693.1 P
MSDIARFPVYDLHSHTRASDGLLTPAELVQRAVEMRVGVLAITDHDSVAGVEEAQQTARDHDLPIKVLAGAEISTLWENHEIHIVGLDIDIHHPAMVTFLAGQHDCRRTRAQEIGERLAKARIPDALAGAMRLADGGIITRGHFARFLIEQGKADNMVQVFKNYLARGKTGYVPPQWCTIKQAIDAIHHSGGCAVLAHPGRYGLSAKWLKRLVAHFREAGGDAMEVAQCQQAPNERTTLAQYARDNELAASQGSDFHQPCPWIELGRKLWLPAAVEPVWERFPALAPGLTITER